MIFRTAQDKIFWLESYPLLEMDGEVLGARLSRWLALRSLGRKPSTQRFYREVVAAMMLHLPGAFCSPNDVTEFASKLAGFCPSRWNAIVSAIRYITDDPKALKYRKLRFRDFTPPTQEQFTALLAECDRMPRSRAGLIIRFLSLTGLRIAEARQVRWSHLCSDCLRLPGSITKSGLPRIIPLLPGSKEVLDRLKAISKTQFVLPHAHMRTALANACRKVGIPRLSYHDFRHFFATRSIQCGADVPTVSRWMGHQDGGALLSRMYYTLCDEHSQRMAQRVNIL